MRRADNYAKRRMIEERDCIDRTCRKKNQARQEAQRGLRTKMGCSYCYQTQREILFKIIFFQPTALGLFDFAISPI